MLFPISLYLDVPLRADISFDDIIDKFQPNRYLNINRAVVDKTSFELTNNNLDKFLCFKEALEMPHLPESGKQQDDGLSDTPPQHTLVCALTCLTETLFTILKRNNQYKTEDLF